MGVLNLAVSLVQPWWQLFWERMRYDPIAWLTATLVLTTIIYTRLMHRSVRIVALQFLSQIEPYVDIGVTGPGPAQSRPGTAWLVRITTQHAPAIILYGWFWLWCPHKFIIAGKTLDKERGRVLLENGFINVELIPEDSKRCSVPDCRPWVMGGLSFADMRNWGMYTYDLGPDGAITKAQELTSGLMPRVWARIKYMLREAQRIWSLRGLSRWQKVRLLLTWQW